MSNRFPEKPLLRPFKLEVKFHFTWSLAMVSLVKMTYANAGSLLFFRIYSNLGILQIRTKVLQILLVMLPIVEVSDMVMQPGIAAPVMFLG